MRAAASWFFLLLGLWGVPGQGAGHGLEREAFLKARAVTEPEARVAALAGFAESYPGSPLRGRAEALELETLLAAFPERTEPIHTLAAREVNAARAGFERWAEEARLADALASAGPGGADLADASLWAKDAVLSLTEESYRREMRLAEVRYKLPALPLAERRREYLHTRASFLAALANVELRTSDLLGAERALAEAARCDPLSSEGSSLRGQLALARHEDGTALAQFERAEAEGDLPERWRVEAVRLYAQAHEGGASGLEDEVDALYQKLFPPLFALSPRRLPAGGHTALLELFTGSGCSPCVAPDLAVESLLGTYSRKDLAVLEFDEHIPRPDPLANPDTVTRAAAYGVEQTPQAFLDGDEIPVGGASRSDVENVVVGFADAIEDRAAVPTGVGLALAVHHGPGKTLQATAKVTLETPVKGAPPLPARAVVRLALAEDEVRYSGENGIRYHRMVVRATAPLRVVELQAPAPVEASFDPQAISERQVAYLRAYEKTNDRFGEFQFRTTAIPLRTDHLAVVAWVEDPKTHEVLETAFSSPSE